MNMSGIASPVMMLPEDDHDHDHEHSSRGYNHADFVKHKLEEILTTDHIPGLTKLLIQIKPFHGSKHCFWCWDQEWPIRVCGHIRDTNKKNHNDKNKNGIGC
ncbi:hypothetical protein KEM48_001297 [Puccinia striiformis f. sp. tritici PST-130]|nr:hypothetical protein KEM48_001297 [Puccinia striiformis f. sp. tritici PST-130]